MKNKHQIKTAKKLQRHFHMPYIVFSTYFRAFSLKSSSYCLNHFYVVILKKIPLKVT